MRGKMDCFGRTDVGKRREVNEDQFLFADLNKSMLVHHTSLQMEAHTRLFGKSQGQLLLVADGMGGHAAGERASTLAVGTLTRYVLNHMPWFLGLHENEENDLLDDLKVALDRCQDRIEAEAEANFERRGMGTTLTMAYVIWPRLYVIHAGDSRCYLFRGGRLKQITKDHTLAQQLVDRGVLPPEEAETSRWSHVLWNCVGGGSPELAPEVYKAPLAVGDTLLLCTDGLSKPVPDARIAEILGKHRSADETSRQLVDAANEAGGPDNITVVVAHFRDAEQTPKQAAAEAVIGDSTATIALPGEEATVESRRPYSQPAVPVLPL